MKHYDVKGVGVVDYPDDMPTDLAIADIKRRYGQAKGSSWIERGLNRATETVEHTWDDIVKNFEPREQKAPEKPWDISGVAADLWHDIKAPGKIAMDLMGLPYSTAMGPVSEGLSAATGGRLRPQQIEGAIDTVSNAMLAAMPAGRPLAAVAGIKTFGEWASESGPGKVYQKMFQPELYSDAAMRSDPAFAQYASRKQADRDSVQHWLESEHQWWGGKSLPESIGYLDDLKSGKALRPSSVPGSSFVHPTYQARVDRHRLALERMRNEEAAYGGMKDFSREYVHSLWTDREKAQRAFWGTNFDHLSDIVRHGLRNGLQLKTHNPEQLIGWRLMAGTDMLNKMELLNDLEDMQMAFEARKVPGGAGRFLRPNTGDPWRTVRAPNGREWIIAPDIHNLWDNAVTSRSLWENETLVGTAFRGWMKWRAVTIPLKLSFSAFHPAHIAHINFSDSMARAARALAKGDVMESLTHLENATTGQLRAGVPGIPHAGKEARAAWLKPRWERTPMEQTVVDTLNEMGMSPQLSEELRIQAKRDLIKAWESNTAFKYTLPIQALRRVVEVIQHPIFEYWIPNLKVEAALKRAAQHLKEHPELVNDPVNRRLAFRAIGKQIDGRFGQMFYGGLFHNRWIKDSLMAAFLSWGWNFGGLMREVMAAPMRPLARTLSKQSPERKVLKEANNSLAFVMWYFGSLMAFNGVKTYLNTGHMPYGLDWLMYRIGGKNPDGSERRATNPTFARDIPMAEKHIEAEGPVTGPLKMMWEKMVLEPYWDLLPWNNRTYDGYDIWDPHAGPMAKVGQMLEYLFTADTPISAESIRRERIAEGKQPYPHNIPNPTEMTTREWASFAGFGPAPSYVGRSPIQNMIFAEADRYKKPFSHPRDRQALDELRNRSRAMFLLAQQKGDREAMVDALSQAFKGGVSVDSLRHFGIPGDIIAFRSLDAESQIAILKASGPSDFVRYFPVAHRPLKANADLQKRWQTSYVRVQQ